MIIQDLLPVYYIFITRGFCLVLRLEECVLKHLLASCGLENHKQVPGQHKLRCVSTPEF